MSAPDLRGLKDTIAFLDLFPKRVQNGALRVGATAGAGVIREKARANVAKKSGLTAKAIKTGSPRVEGTTVRIRVRLAGKHSFLGKLLEYGVKPHFITAGDIGGLSPRLLTRRANAEGVSQPVSQFSDGSFHPQRGVLKIGENYVTQGVLHPGFAAQPFLRTALDTEWSAALRAMGDRMRGYIKDKTGFTAPVQLHDVDDPEG